MKNKLVVVKGGGREAKEVDVIIKGQHKQSR